MNKDFLFKEKLSSYAKEALSLFGVVCAMSAGRRLVRQVHKMWGKAKGRERNLRGIAEREIYWELGQARGHIGSESL